MHSKLKGSLGEVVVASDLMKRGYSVFKELGDLSKIDLIAIVDKKPIRIQVKAIRSRNGKVELRCNKSGPGYSFRYTEDDVDVFAVYILDTEQILYISSAELLQHSCSIIFRLKPAMNNQEKKIRLAEHYIDFKRVLRDYTQDTLQGVKI